MDTEVEVAQALPDDPGFSFVMATVRLMAQQELLDVECTCDSCLLRLSLELWEAVQPFKPVLAA